MRRRFPMLFSSRRTPAPGSSALALEAVALDRLSKLEWRQEGRWYRPTWTLWSESARVATMEPEGFNGRHGRFETREGCWHVRRRGLFGGFDVLRQGVEAPVVHFKPGWLRGGTLERAAGDALHWKPGFLGRDATVENSEEFAMFTIRSRGAVLRFEGEVAIEQAGRALPDLMPLLALAWWLILERPRHSAH